MGLNIHAGNNATTALIQTSEWNPEDEIEIGLDKWKEES
jgi:hypothetical protein